MKKIILMTITWTCFSIASLAQTDDDSIKSIINTYFDGFTKGDSASLNKAFYTGALLRNLNKATGKLISYSYAGTSGVATIELQFADFKYIDLLSLLKINDQWKIVCRVYSRVESDVQLKGSAAVEAAAAPTKKNSANAKPKKNDGW